MEPYILAYSNNFIEVRECDSGILRQVLVVRNLRVLDEKCAFAAIDGSNEYRHIVNIQKTC